MPAAVTILLPARDAAATLPACLRSIARQTLADFRCLVVDDGSRDRTVAIAREMAVTDARFEVCTSPGRGLVAALQHGLARCDGEFTARMDADDVMHQERLRLQLAELRRTPALQGVGCHVRPFPSASTGSGMRAYTDWLATLRSAADVRRDAFVECPLLHPTWMLRTAVLREFGYRDVDWPEDYDLLLRLLLRGHELGVVPRRLHAWRRRDDSATITDPRYRLDAFPRLKAAFLADGFLAASDRYILWGHGDTGRAMRRELGHRGRSPIAVVELHPRKLGQRIDGAPVVPPESVPSLPPLPIVVCVAGLGPRTAVRSRLAALGRVELRDYVCTA